MWYSFSGKKYRLRYENVYEKWKAVHYSGLLFQNWLQNTQTDGNKKMIKMKVIIHVE